MAQQRYIDKNSLPFRLQSGIAGSPYQELSGTTDNFQLSLVRVQRIDYTSGKIFYTNLGTANAIQADQEATATLPRDFFGYNQNGDPFGRNKIIPEGSQALIGYIEGISSRPIVINIYPSDSDDLYGLAPSFDEQSNDGDNDQRSRTWVDKTVYPNQNVKLASADGTYTRTLDGQSFLQIMPEDDDPESPMFDVISEKYDGVSDGYADGLWDSLNSKPYNMYLQAPAILLQHQSNASWDKHRSKFLIKPTGQSLIRMSNLDSPDKSLGVDLGLAEGVSIFTTQDTNQLEGSTKNSQLNLTNENTIELKVQDGDNKGSVVVTPRGTEIDGDLIASNEALQQLNKQLTKVSESAQRLQDTLNKVGTEFLLGLPQTIANHDGDIKKANDNASSASKKADQVGTDLTTKTEAINESIKGINEQVTTFSTDLTSLKTELNTSINQVQTNLTKYSTANDSKVTSLQGNVSNMQKTLDNLSGLDSQIKDLTSSMGTLQEAVNTASTGVNNNFSRITNLVKQLNANTPAGSYTVSP